jgi:hypothetical protein
MVENGGRLESSDRSSGSGWRDIPRSELFVECGVSDRNEASPVSLDRGDSRDEGIEALDDLRRPREAERILLPLTVSAMLEGGDVQMEDDVLSLELSAASDGLVKDIWGIASV